MLRLLSQKGSGGCEYRQQRTMADQRQDANVLNDYYDAFRKGYAAMEIREADDKKNS